MNAKSGRWSYAELMALNKIEGLPTLDRKQRRDLDKRLRKVRKPKITEEAQTPLDDRIHAACGQPMGMHPKPAYWPCPAMA